MGKQVQLIMEQAFMTPASEIKILEEGYEANGSPKLIFKAILQTANEKNFNNRVYPAEVLQQVVSKLAPKAQVKNLFSELDHPLPETNDPDVLRRRAVAVKLKEACALITDIQFDGQNVVGVFEVIDTPNGRILRSLVKDGAQIGFSLRAVGSVDKQPDGTLKVTSLNPVTYDVVSTPSHSSAIVTEILNESSDLGNVLRDLSVIQEMESDIKGSVIMEGEGNEVNEGICAAGICTRGTYNELTQMIVEQALENEKLNKIFLKI